MNTGSKLEKAITENNKTNHLSVLCDANERSEPRFRRDKCTVSY
jgi:hypothetical protein